MGTQQQSLKDFVSSLSGGDGLRVEERLGAGYVRLRVAEAERRQAAHDIRSVEDAVIELLRNARDAGATRIFVGLAREGAARQIWVADDGCGIPPEMWGRIFDARVTSKLDTMHTDRWGVHGRGMALFAIRENATDARVVASDVGAGTMLTCTFDCTKTTERKDQSSWPRLATRDGKRTLVGPRNVIRTSVEFALEERDRVLVYVGSPSEMVATMRRRVIQSATVPAPAIELPARAADARELQAAAATLGVEMSERTALRIIKGEIAPVRHAAAIVEPTKSAVSAPQTQSRRIQMSDEDRSMLARECADAFSRVAERYYVTTVGEPRVSVADGRVVITIAYEDED